MPRTAISVPAAKKRPLRARMGARQGPCAPEWAQDKAPARPNGRKTRPGQTFRFWLLMKLTAIVRRYLSYRLVVTGTLAGNAILAGLGADWGRGREQSSGSASRGARCKAVAPEA
jgi:hypothetical protein